MGRAVCLCLRINYFLSEVRDNWYLCTLRPTAAQQTGAKQLIDFFSPCSFAIVSWKDIARRRHVKDWPDFSKVLSSSSLLQTGERTSSWESVGKKCFGQCEGSLKLHDQPKVTLGTVLPLGEGFSARARITYRKATYLPPWLGLRGWPSPWGSNKKPAWGGTREKRATDEWRCFKVWSDWEEQRTRGPVYFLISSKRWG